MSVWHRLQKYIQTDTDWFWTPVSYQSQNRYLTKLT